MTFLAPSHHVRPNLGGTWAADRLHFLKFENLDASRSAVASESLRKINKIEEIRRRIANGVEYQRGRETPRFWAAQAVGLVPQNPLRELCSLRGSLPPTLVRIQPAK